MRSGPSGRLSERVTVERPRAGAERCLRHRVGGRHVTPEWVLHSNFGCCIGTTQKSATYKICGAAERRAVPIRKLVENKERRLKEKSYAPNLSPSAPTRKTLRCAWAAVKGQARWRGSRWSPCDCGFRFGNVPAGRGPTPLPYFPVLPSWREVGDRIRQGQSGRDGAGAAVPDDVR